MRPRERIPLHDHSDRNSGGIVASSTVVQQIITTGGGATAGGSTTASAVSVLDGAGYFTGTNVEAVLAELGAAPAALALDDLTDVNAAAPSDNDVLTWDTGTSRWIAQAPPGASGGDTSGQFIAGWDGGGSALASGAIVDIVAPFTGTITSWTLLPDQSGSAAVDIATDTYAGYPTFTSIVAAAPPTLTSATKATSSTLTGWTTGVTAGDILRFTLSSASTVTRLLCVVAYSRP